MRYHRSNVATSSMFRSEWDALQLGPLPTAATDVSKAVCEALIAERLSRVRKPITDVLLSSERFSCADGSSLCDLWGLKSPRVLDQTEGSFGGLLFQLTESVVRASGGVPPSSAIEPSGPLLTDAMVRAYAVWDLMVLAAQHEITLEFVPYRDQMTFQSMLITTEDNWIGMKPGADVSSGVPRSGWISLGEYGYNDNVTAVIVDVFGTCKRSAGLPMTLYAIDYWDDDWEIMKAADAAFFDSLVETGLAAGCDENDGSYTIVRVDGLEGDVPHFLQRALAYQCRPLHGDE